MGLGIGDLGFGTGLDNFLASCHVTPLPRSYAHNDFKESLEGSFRRYLNQNIPDITPLIKMDINSHAYYLFSQLASVNYSSINHLLKDERHNINHFDAQG